MLPSAVEALAHLRQAPALQTEAATSTGRRITPHICTAQAATGVWRHEMHNVAAKRSNKWPAVGLIPSWRLKVGRSLLQRKPPCQSLNQPELTLSATSEGALMGTEMARSGKTGRRVDYRSVRSPYRNGCLD